MSADPIQPVKIRETAPSLVYGAMLDAQTCPECAALAGLEFTSRDPGCPQIPNPACTHPEGCRCGWL